MKANSIKRIHRITFAGIFLLISVLFLQCPHRNSPKLFGALNLGAGISLNSVVLTESGGSTAVSEGIGSDTYTIVLAKAPTSDVLVNISFDTTQLRVNGLTTSPVSLSFTASNWSSVQTVTLEAVNDGIIEGTHTKSINHTSVSVDSNYSGLTISSVTVSITDSKGGATLTESGGSTSVSEGTDTETYTIVLTTAPIADVAVSITFDNTQLKVNSSTTSPIQLTFTSTNWSSAQTITVEALFDNVTEGTQTKSVTHTVSSSDSNYNGLTIPDVSVTITDTNSAAVKGSFQSGNLTLSSASQSITLTTVVDSSKAFVICNAQYGGSNTANAITCQLNSAGTQVVIQNASGISAVVDWYVMEYGSGATVQRGATTFATSDTVLNASLATPISTSKTFVIGYTRSTVAGATADGNRTIRAVLTSSTNLELSRNETGGDAVTEWQVVQFDGSKVQSGTLILSHGNTSATASLPNTMNLNSSFLLFNYKAAAATVGVERDFYVRGSYTNSSTLAFNRVGNSQDIDISWFAIEMVDGTTVQSGSATMTAGSGTNTSSILSNPVTTTKSMIVFSNDTDTNPILIPNAFDQDSGTYTATFGSSTQVNFNRNNDDANGATINWFVISFQ